MLGTTNFSDFDELRVGKHVATPRDVSQVRQSALATMQAEAKPLPFRVRLQAEGSERRSCPTLDSHTSCRPMSMSPRCGDNTPLITTWMSYSSPVQTW